MDFQTVSIFAGKYDDSMLRKVKPEDAKAIAEIYNGYVLGSTATFETSPVSENEMRKRIEDISSRFPYFVYEKDGKVAGYCYAHQWKEREAYRLTLETTVYLSDDCAGLGIGHRLMSGLISECRRMGFHSLIACITAENLSSIAFHEKLGFTRVSSFREVGFKFGRYLDVVDMELLLSES